MQFSTPQTLEILRDQTDSVEVYDERSFTRGTAPPAAVLNLVAARHYVGIGNARRIRAVRPLPSSWSCIASQTTRPMRADGSLVRGRGQLLGSRTATQQHRADHVAHGGPDPSWAASDVARGRVSPRAPGAKGGGPL